MIQNKKRYWKTLYKAITAVTVVATISCIIFIMANRVGIVDKYDFGAGAYYYTDIPNYQEVIQDNIYHTAIPLWVYIILFLGWGWLMWRVWCKVENSKTTE